MILIKGKKRRKMKIIVAKGEKQEKEETTFVIDSVAVQVPTKKNGK